MTKKYRSNLLNKKYRRRQIVMRQRLALAGGAAVLVLGTVLFARGFGKNGGETLSGSSSQQSQTAAETAFSAQQLSVNGIDLSGKTRSEARELLLQQYPWNITVSHDGQSDKVEDLITPAIDAFLDRICSETPSGALSFSPASEEVFQSAAKDAAANFAKLWDKPAENSSINGYDAANDRFTFTEGKAGRALDQDAFVKSLTDAVQSGDLNADITASFRDAAPELDEAAARKQYELLATFTTDTTANEKRNTNVRLAAEALNGTVVGPGEEFSFNRVIGERTAEKGYQEAAAYNSGEVVQEIGGGVCQISSTLYNTAFQAGMSITYRRSHTFEPNYVTPGQDATISWELPDFRFVNTSKAAIGIRASYENRKATVSIYGVPVLEKGISLDLESEKTEELPPPDPTYIEDQTLAPGKEVTEKAATNGSHWVTYKIVLKDGKEIERTKDHEKTYKGHAAVIRRNTSGVQLSPDKAKPVETPAVAPTIDGLQDDDTMPTKNESPDESRIPNETRAPETAPSSAPGEKTEAGSESSTAGGTEQTAVPEEPVTIPSESSAPSESIGEHPLPPAAPAP